MSKIIDLLRAKYHTPQNVMAALGLDMSLLYDDGDDMPNRAVRSRRIAHDEAPLVTRRAMDEAIKGAVAKAENRVARREKARREAERAVRPYVGELAMDGATSAAGVYRKALSLLGVEGVDKIDASALPLVLKHAARPGARREVSLGMDSAAAADFHARFPHAARLGRAL